MMCFNIFCLHIAEVNIDILHQLITEIENDVAASQEESYDIAAVNDPIDQPDKGGGLLSNLHPSLTSIPETQPLVIYPHEDSFTNEDKTNLNHCDSSDGFKFEANNLVSPVTEEDNDSSQQEDDDNQSQSDISEYLTISK